MPSSFGWHRVRVVEVEPGRVTPFEEVEHQIFAAFQRREIYATSGPRIIAGRDVLDPIEVWIAPTSGAVQERVTVWPAESSTCRWRSARGRVRSGSCPEVTGVTRASSRSYTR